MGDFKMGLGKEKEVGGETAPGLPAVEILY